MADPTTVNVDGGVVVVNPTQQIGVPTPPPIPSQINIPDAWSQTQGFAIPIEEIGFATYKNNLVRNSTTAIINYNFQLVQWLLSGQADNGTADPLHLSIDLNGFSFINFGAGTGNYDEVVRLNTDLNVVPFVAGQQPLQQISYTPTASNSFQVVGYTGTVRLVNDGIGPVFITVGTLSTPTPIVPTDGNPQTGFLMLGDSVETFTLPFNCSLRAVSASSASGKLLILRGDGI